MSSTETGPISINRLSSDVESGEKRDKKAILKVPVHGRVLARRLFGSLAAPSSGLDTAVSVWLLIHPRNARLKVLA
jgi:hypothetical protein